MDSQNQEKTKVDFNPKYLKQILDQATTEMFTDPKMAFLSQVMAGQEFIWSREIENLNVTPDEFHINPEWFDGLSPKDRVYNIRHGMWRIAMLQEFRRGLRDRELWDEACNHFVNHLMAEEGMHPSDQNIHLDPAYKGLAEEEIYSRLQKKPPSENQNPKPKQGPQNASNSMCSTSSPNQGQDPSRQMTDQEVQKQVQRLQEAQMSAGKEAGDLPGSLEKLLDQFVKSKLPWEGLLADFFTELGDKLRSYRRRNRRYRNIYMPSWVPAEDGLAHLVWAIDCSGSTTDDMVARCNSEIKHIFDTFNVKKITIILFDTIIQETIVYNEGDDFDKIHIKGRGGTSFKQVRQFLIDNKPTAGVIFSDMYCSVMEPMPKESQIPLLWIAIDRTPGSVTVNEGKIIYFEE